MPWSNSKSDHEGENVMKSIERFSNVTCSLISLQTLPDGHLTLGETSFDGISLSVYPYRSKKRRARARYT